MCDDAAVRLLNFSHLVARLKFGYHRYLGTAPSDTIESKVPSSSLTTSESHLLLSSQPPWVYCMLQFAVIDCPVESIWSTSSTLLTIFIMKGTRHRARMAGSQEVCEPGPGLGYSGRGTYVAHGCVRLKLTAPTAIAGDLEQGQGERGRRYALG